MKRFVRVLCLGIVGGIVVTASFVAGNATAYGYEEPVPAHLGIYNAIARCQCGTLLHFRVMLTPTGPKFDIEYLHPPDKEPEITPEVDIGREFKI